jgi:hypothetical protein
MAESHVVSALTAKRAELAAGAGARVAAERYLAISTGWALALGSIRLNFPIAAPRWPVASARSFVDLLRFRSLERFPI